MIHRSVSHRVHEQVRLEGHIIDSMILPKVLDIILREGSHFRIIDVQVGQRPEDLSHALIEIESDSSDQLERTLQKILPHGAMSVHGEDCVLKDADLAGCFPDDFYATTNLPTEVRVEGHWINVESLEMDCGIVVDPSAGTARCVPMHQVQVGDKMVVGRRGVRVQPLERRVEDPASFKFMTSAVSSEKPKAVGVRDIAECLRSTRDEGKKILLVGGPAIIHTGAAEHVCQLIRAGYIHVLFAGNALATHDIEQALFGTSLGVNLSHGIPLDEGHEHHLRSINRIRRLGGIRRAVEQGVLKSGIMYECIKHNVDYVLAGSIRDDGPLPDVITDAIKAIDEMRRLRENVGFCLMIATLLHSIATGNILPASVRSACVDINPATVTKLADRGTSQSVGIVTDVEPFLRALVADLHVE